MTLLHYTNQQERQLLAYHCNDLYIDLITADYINSITECSTQYEIEKRALEYEKCMCLAAEQRFISHNDFMQYVYAENAKTLQNLGNAIAYSSLKRLVEKTGDSDKIAMINNLAHDNRLLKNTITAHDNSTDMILKKDKKGNVTERQVTTDSELRRDANKLIDICISDSLDLTNTAIEWLLYYTKGLNAIGQLDEQKVFFVNSSNVRIKDVDIKKRTVKRCIIQLVYKRVQKYIRSQATVKADCKNMYISGLQEGNTQAKVKSQTVNFSDSDSDDTILYRLNKYERLHVNNDMTADETALCFGLEYYSILNELKLTIKQNAIMHYMIQGYSRKAIATALKVKPDNIKSQITEIKRKAKRCNFNTTIIDRLEQKELQKEQRNTRLQALQSVINPFDSNGNDLRNIGKKAI